MNKESLDLGSSSPLLQESGYALGQNVRERDKEKNTMQHNAVKRTNRRVGRDPGSAAGGEPFGCASSCGRIIRLILGRQ
jgi:hypothetical protein